MITKSSFSVSKGFWYLNEIAFFAPIIILTVALIVSAQAGNQNLGPHSAAAGTPREFGGDRLAIRNYLGKIDRDLNSRSPRRDYPISRFASSKDETDQSFPKSPGADASFNGDISDGPAKIEAVAVQPDGKIVVGGSPIVNGLPRDGVVRLNLDGTIDNSFNATTPAFPSAIRIQPDGKILLAGNSDDKIVRLNSDGSRDQSFLPGSGPNNSVQDISLLQGGKILIVGYFTQYNGVPISHIARLNSNGVLDPSFLPPVTDGAIYKMAIQPDGKIVIVGVFGSVGGLVRKSVARLNTDGSVDPSFDPGTNTSYESFAVAIQPNGKILVGAMAGIPLIRLESNGAVDATFAAAYLPSSGSSVHAISILSDGKILAGGAYNDGNGKDGNGNFFSLVKFEAGGALDTSFASQLSLDDNSVPEIFSLDMAPGGKIVAVGDFYKVGSSASINKHIVRLNSNGTIDAGFTGSVEGIGQVSAVVQQGDGKIIAGGAFQTANGTSHRNLVRFNTDGSVDGSFNAGTNDYILSVALQPDDKILIGGKFSVVNGVDIFGAARLNADGSLDPTFHLSEFSFAYFFSIVVQPDGKILCGGNVSTTSLSTGIVRLNANGTLDSTFVSTPESVSVYKIALLPNGKFYVGGAFTNLGGRAYVARLNSDGTVDNTFDPGTGPDATVLTLALQPDGKILIGGDFLNVNGNNRSRIARLNTNGSVDQTLSTGSGFNTSVLDLAILPGGQGTFSILAGGYFTAYNGANRTAIAAIKSDGSLNSFVEPVNGYVYTLAVQSDGKILIGGNFLGVGGQPHNAIARVIVNAADPCFSTPITFGQTFNGSIGPSSCILNSKKTDLYSFTGLAGQQIALMMYSRSLDIKLEILGPQGNIVATDFNLAGADSIRLPSSGYFPIPDSGTYLIRAISGTSALSGDYSLSLYGLSSNTCDYSLSPAESIAPSTGGSFYFDVITQPGCPITSQPAASGTIYNALSFSGGRVAFTVLPNAGNARQETITIAGNTHTIRQFGSFAPANDFFANAQAISGATSPASSPLIGYNSNATAEQGEPFHAGRPAAKSVWYTWTTPDGLPGLYTFSTSGSSFDTVMAVYACPTNGNCSFDNLTAVSSNDDTTSFDKTSKVNFNAVAGVQYRIAVDGKNGAIGTINLAWRPYKRLYRLYLQNYNGFGSPLIPDSIKASNGINTVIPSLVSLGVYEFDLPADNSVYIVSITGPTGIVWDPNNFPLDTSFRMLNELMAGPSAGGQNNVSNAQNQTPRYIVGYIKNITAQEAATISVSIGSSRGPNPRDPVPCTPISSTTISGMPYATYQCITQPQTLHDIVPNMAGRNFTVSVKSFDRPIDNDVWGVPSSGFIAANGPTYNLNGHVLNSGVGTTVDLAYTPAGNDLEISLRAFTDSSGAYSFSNLAPNTYRIMASRSGFVFDQPAIIDVHANKTVDITAQALCTYTPENVKPSPAAGGPNLFQISTNNSTCEWTAASDVPWISINSGATVSTGPVHFTVEPNPRFAYRMGSIRISGRPEAVTFIQLGSDPTFGSVSGKVLTPDLKGIKNAVLTITDQLGNKQTATTNSFGLFTVTNLPVGASYTISVASKRFRFIPTPFQIANISNSLDFVGIE